ncbi:hypothetical protein QTI66_30195 [Variovorax sp. J22R133]|uniref:hypothetical protein n=1 Tax=Variovorax brevis TaxID=3053503 RepID=UPI002576F8E6|nr:hypothetical protein [Variovorax sp. J22R133]MDM0116422.1 hypothetical protein [Variovorax sp. J22R133]
MLIPVTLRPELTFYGLIALHAKEALRECRHEGRPYSPFAHAGAPGAYRGVSDGDARD